MTANISGTINQTIICAKFGLTNSEQEIARTANTGLAKVAVQCSEDTFVVNQSLILRINICGKNRHLRQARNRRRRVGKYSSVSGLTGT